MKAIYLLYALASVTIALALFVGYQLLNIRLAMGPGLELHTAYLPFERFTIDNFQLTSEGAQLIFITARYSAIFLLLIFTVTFFWIHNKIDKRHRNMLLTLFFVQLMAFTPMIYRSFFPFIIL